MVSNLGQSISAIYTPEWLAKDMTLLADIKPGMNVLEPNAGYGALAVPARDAGGIVTCFELNEAACSHLQTLGFDVSHRDFLACPHSDRKLYERIIMNPPFSRGRYLKHVLQASKYLREGGRLVALVSPLYMDGDSKDEQELRHLTVNRGKLYNIHYPHFDIDDQKVATSILVLE